MRGWRRPVRDRKINGRTKREDLSMTTSTAPADLTPDFDTSTWDPALDAVVAAPANHRVLFENHNLRVLEVNLAPDEEEPTHHHRWHSIFVLDQVQGPVHDIAPD